MMYSIIQEESTHLSKLELKYLNSSVQFKIVQQLHEFDHTKSPLPFTNHANKRELHFEIELLKVKQSSFHLSHLKHSYEKLHETNSISKSSTYSHSIVDGGFDVTSYRTRLTFWTSLTIRTEIFSSTSHGMRAQSDVIPSIDVTARIPTA